MKPFLLFFLTIITTFNTFAACPVADASARKNGLSFAISQYTECALKQNDDDAQLTLARYFKQQEKNINQSLFYYHLAADNGNAIAQVELANLLLDLDKTQQTRQQILDYYQTIQKMIKTQTLGGIQLIKITPYALLILANEPISNKWYYPSNVHTAPNAAKQLQTYTKTLSEAKKVAGQQEVQIFKNRKLLEAAKTILTPDEYSHFEQVIFPQQGMPDAFTAKQELDKLKQKIESLKKS